MSEIMKEMWKSHVPIAVLLLVVVGLTVWSFLSSIATTEGKTIDVVKTLMY